MLRDRIDQLEAERSQLSSDVLSLLRGDQQTRELIRDLLREQQSGGTKDKTRKVRVAAPNSFSGAAEEVDGFLSACWLNFQNDTVYDTDRAKITFVLSYMKEGSAAIWADNVVKAMRNGEGTGSYTTYKTFEDDVIANFKGGAQVEEAQSKIERLVQGTGTATAYFTLLDALNKTAGYDDTTMIRLLKVGLNRQVVQGIYNGSSGTGLPKTYEGWKLEAIKQDGVRQSWNVLSRTLLSGSGTGFSGNRNERNNSGQGGGFRGGPQGGSGSNQRRSEFNRGNFAPATTNAPNLGASAGVGTPAAPSRTPTSPPAVSNPVPMDIDRASTNRGLGTVCFGCGQRGHIRRNCPREANRNPSQFRAMNAEPEAEGEEETSEQDFPEDQE
jgi:hypothetical protein